MGENSKISWTDNTFNPWWGCVKVSPACDNCYAESFSRRVGQEVWGTDAPRRFFGDKHWDEPLKWNANALNKLGRPARVFCASMADVFEDRPELGPHRTRLFHLIVNTPNLLWNLLTKRHTELKNYASWLELPNVRFGVTVENQTYDFRLVHGVTWVSYEPALGPLELYHASMQADVDWVIIGGESGAGAREMKLEWALSMIEQCKSAGVAVHFKQTGDVLARKLGLKDKSGKDPTEWPKELRVQEFPK
jgi:protein gp37